MPAHPLPYLFGRRPIDIYYLAFPSDSYRLQAAVYFAYLVELVQVVVATHDAYRQLASGWGNLEELDNIGLYWITIQLSTSFSAVLCQLFYAWRIKMLSQNHWVAWVISLASCISRSVRLISDPTYVVMQTAVAGGVVALASGVLCHQAGHFSTRECQYSQSPSMNNKIL